MVQQPATPTHRVAPNAAEPDARLRLLPRPAQAGAAELWGGIECTVNRVGDAWFDQLARSGHAERLDDLDRIAALGIRTLRYPVLWERVAPDGLERADWRWVDERLGRLRELGIRPIVGLVHHGSGPAGTHLLDPGFADGLAAFARAAAERFPWVEDWTPVNEPLTTARFAALYGHWYPHARDERVFIRALVTQCRAVQQAMGAIRDVIPQARLVQTEDLGKTWSTPPLAYQAAYENERRWLSLDFLCGRVSRTHPLWAHLWWLGLDADDLFPLLEEPCPPDVIGFNYYLTTERFLDHRLEHYPPALHGGNGRDAYADVEAVRVRQDGIDGVGPLLREAWTRYRRPLAITEAHLGCTREDQLRWLAEAWRAAHAARAEGIDLRAVTVWSLLGAYDWHCLLTRCDEVYEPGAFDLRAPAPRPTALARLAAQLAAGEEPDHPLLADPGWWRRPERLLYPPWPPDSAGEAGPSHLGGREPGAGAPDAVPHAISKEPGRTSGPRVLPRPRPRPLLIVGAEGPLGATIVAACRGRGIRVLPLAAGALVDPAVVAGFFDEQAPWAVVDARLRQAPVRGEDGAGRLQAVVREAEWLAAACGERSLPLVVVSSSLVFDGAKADPYVESDPVGPVDPPGRLHAAVEAVVAACHPAPLVIRTGLPLPTAVAIGGPPLPIEAAAPTDPRRPVSVATLPDLAHAVLDLLIDEESGIWHLAHPEAVPWQELRQALEAKGIATGAAARSVLQGPATVLGSERGWVMPPLAQALDRLAG